MWYNNIVTYTQGAILFKVGDLVKKARPYSKTTYCLHGGREEDFPIGWTQKITHVDLAHPIGPMIRLRDWWFDETEFDFFDPKLEIYKKHLRDNV